MRNLFKPIITTICLLLTMSAFGQESASEIYDNLDKEYRLEQEKEREEREAKRIESYKDFLINDALKGLEYLDLDLDARDFTAQIGDSEEGFTRTVFLSSTQYVCRYITTSFYSSLDRFEYSLSCFKKEDSSSRFDILRSSCFSCDY